MVRRGAILEQRRGCAKAELGLPPDGHRDPLSSGAAGLERPLGIHVGQLASGEGVYGGGRGQSERAVRMTAALEADHLCLGSCERGSGREQWPVRAPPRVHSAEHGESRALRWGVGHELE